MIPINDRTVHRNRWFQIVLSAIVALYLYLNLFTFSNTPCLLAGDATFFWADALRMLRGERAYRDFFQFTPPGTDFFYMSLFRVFGTGIWVTDLAVILLGVALCWICFDLASRIVDRGWALLTTGLFLVFIYGRLLDATHHWFSLLAIVCAIHVLWAERTALRVVIAGVLLGIACFFTQTTGVLGLLGLGLALFGEQHSEKIWRNIFRLQFLLLISFVVTWGAENTYFLATVDWKQLWYLWITYASQHAMYAHHFLWPHELMGDVHKTLTTGLQRLFILAMMLCLYPFAFWGCVRRRCERTVPNGIQLLLLILPGVFMLFGVLIRPNWNRVYVVSMPALILFVWSIAGVPELRRYTKLVLWAAVACSGIWQTVSFHRLARVTLELPAGHALVRDVSYGAELAWLAQHTKPGDSFFQADGENTYLPLKLHSPLYIDWLTPDRRTPPEYVDLTIAQIEHSRVVYILWSPQIIGPVGPKIDEQDNLSPLREYLNSHYKCVQKFPSQDEIWQRQPD